MAAGLPAPNPSRGQSVPHIDPRLLLGDYEEEDDDEDEDADI